MKVTGLQIYINCFSNIPICAALETQRFAKKIQDLELFFKMGRDLYLGNLKSKKVIEKLPLDTF